MLVRAKENEVNEGRENEVRDEEKGEKIREGT